jgi:uncharacterized protein YkwD
MCRAARAASVRARRLAHGRERCGAVAGDTARKKLEDRVVELVNLERSRRGLGALVIDERLRLAARGHSAAMAKRGCLAHQLPRGPSPLDRMLAAGVGEPGGENIAVGQRSPANVVSAWMRSIPHRRNILDGTFRTIGVGVHHARGPWWTQNFGY